MRKIAVMLGLLALVACTKQKFAKEPCSFELGIDSVRGTKVSVSITPENPTACYSVTIMSENEAQFNWSDTQLISWFMEDMTDIYELYKSDEDGLIGSFADIFCYRGGRSHKITRLIPDTDYRLCVFQLDPDKRTPLGALHKMDFHTKQVVMADLTFSLEVIEDDILLILPSNPDAPFFWEYETVAYLDAVNEDPYTFHYNIIDMYETYGFMEHQVETDMSFWDFSQMDRSIKDGDECVLTISGYADGEINTPVYTAKFSKTNGKITVGPLQPAQ